MPQPAVEKSLQEFCEARKFHSFEGERGLNRLETIVLALGYSNEYRSTLENFLSDNPGAIEALVEWIGSQHSQEWSEGLREAARD